MAGTQRGFGGVRAKPSWLGATVVFLAVLALAPVPANASIKAYENSEQAAYFGQFRKGKCRVVRRQSGKTFHAGAKTTNGAYTLNVDILDFRGFGKEYDVHYGSISPGVNFEGVFDDVDYSNAYPFPGGNPPNSAGTIAFPPDGKKLGLGVYALPNSDYSEGAALAGAMRCKYP